MRIDDIVPVRQVEPTETTQIQYGAVRIECRVKLEIQ